MFKSPPKDLWIFQSQESAANDATDWSRVRPRSSSLSHRLITTVLSRAPVRSTTRPNVSSPAAACERCAMRLATCIGGGGGKRSVLCRPRRSLGADAGIRLHLAPAMHFLRRLSADVLGTGDRPRYLAAPTVSTGCSCAIVDASAPLGADTAHKLVDTAGRRVSMRRHEYYGSIEPADAAAASGHGHGCDAAAAAARPADTAQHSRNMHQFRLEPAAGVPPPLGADEEHARSPSGSQASSLCAMSVENPENETRWYWKYFLGAVHQNYAGVDSSTKAPFFLSVGVFDAAASGQTAAAHEQPGGAKLCRAILWTGNGPRRVCMPYTKNLPIKTVLSKYHGLHECARPMREIGSEKVQRDLAALEDQEGCVNFKFGVILAEHGQRSDIDMLANQNTPGSFEQFVALLGNRIRLNSWGSYRGGLDVSTDTTGTESVHTTFRGHEIMFHVSTMLPFTPDNQQQIERKRHIGNDIVNIIFEVGGDPAKPSFSPLFMKSHFTHIFAVVTYDERTCTYRLWVHSERSVPVYGPAIPRPNEFWHTRTFRQFLLTKLINGEKASFNADAFIEKRNRTVDNMIKDMYIEYLSEPGTSAVAHKVAEPTIGHDRRALGADLFEFVKLGELIKLEKQLCGEVMSLSGPKQKISISSMGRNRQPWQPQLLVRDAPPCDTATSSHAWGPISIAFSGADGSVQLLDRSKLHTLIEAEAQCRQLAVLEEFGIFLGRLDHARDGCLVACPLSDLSLRLRRAPVQRRALLPACRIVPQSVRGCYHFATSDPFALRLHIAACCGGRRVCLLRWAFGPLGPIEQGTNIVKNFALVKEMQVCDDVVSSCVYETGRRPASVRACLATKGHHVYLVDFAHATVRCVPAPTVPKGRMRCVNASSDGDIEEIIYSYDNVSMVYMSDDETHTPQTIFWSGDVQHVVYHFPYVMGFARDVMEVRLVVNGNLLHSMFMPGVCLLSDKRDVVFSVERHGTPPPHAHPHQQPATAAGGEQQQAADWHCGAADKDAEHMGRRPSSWLWKKNTMSSETAKRIDLYRIAYSELVSGQQDTGVAQSHCVNNGLHSSAQHDMVYDKQQRNAAEPVKTKLANARQNVLVAAQAASSTSASPTNIRKLKTKQKSAVDLASSSRITCYKAGSNCSLENVEQGARFDRANLPDHMRFLFDSEHATFL